MSDNDKIKQRQGMLLLTIVAGCSGAPIIASAQEPPVSQTDPLTYAVMDLETRLSLCKPGYALPLGTAYQAVDGVATQLKISWLEASRAIARNAFPDCPYARMVDGVVQP